MNNVDVRSKNEAAPGVKPVDMKLEVVLLGVSHVDRAKSGPGRPRVACRPRRRAPDRAVSIAFPALARLQRWTLPIWNF